MADKLLTFHGPTHFLEVPGFFTIARGESHEIDDHVAEALVRANPELELTIEDLPAKRGGGKRHAAGDKSQPEAHEGEGQPKDPTDQEE